MKTKSQDAIQEEFIKTLRASIPESISLADELADLLKVSSDSAYRRLRGETDFTLGRNLPYFEKIQHLH
jgi:hypothetical protein